VMVSICATKGKGNLGPSSGIEGGLEHRLASNTRTRFGIELGLAQRLKRFELCQSFVNGNSAGAICAKLTGRGEREERLARRG